MTEPGLVQPQHGLSCGEYLIRCGNETIEFLAGGVAHEFNNLLTSITGYAQMALENPEDAELSRRALEAALRASRRGTGIVDRLTSFAGLDDPTWDSDDISLPLADVLAVLEPEFQQRHIQLETDLQSLPGVMTDRRLVRVVLLELLRNAAQALDDVPAAARRLEVRCRSLETEAEILIRDSGPGLPPEARRNAGSPFVTTRGPLGAGPVPEAKGLGLATASGIVHRLGGRLELSSGDEGTEVRVCLPLAENPPWSPGRVLVVDDEAAIRKMFDRFLSRAGYATETAANGAEALSVLGERDVDLVILDQMMPGMSGLEFLDRARALQPHRPLPPVLMITAAYTAELASEAIRRGAAACTSKPINRDRILFLAQSCTGRPVRGGVGGGAQGPAPEGAGGRNRLLVVEPEPLLREVLQLILSRQGYRVQAAGERQAAEDATRAEYFDLILADLHHEGRGAAELVRILRLNNPYTPILVQGVLGQPELGRELARAGATRTITRPVEVDSTLREVHRLLQLFSHQE